MTKQQRQKEYDKLTPGEQELYFYFILEYYLDAQGVNEHWADLIRKTLPHMFSFVDEVERIVNRK